MVRYIASPTVSIFAHSALCGGRVGNWENWEANIIVVVLHQGHLIRGIQDHIWRNDLKRVSNYDNFVSSIARDANGRIAMEAGVQMLAVSRDVHVEALDLDTGGRNIIKTESGMTYTSMSAIRLASDVFVAAFLLIPKQPRLWPIGQWLKIRQKINTKVIWYGIVICDRSVDFRLADKNPGLPRHLKAPTFNRIFASYAREDLSVVESVASIIRSTGLGELRWDLNFIMPGENWSEAIKKEIKTSDSFQLFWSRHAYLSKNVEREWKFALRLNRRSFVKPIYWEHLLYDVHPELRKLHFTRIVLPQFLFA